MAGCCCGGCCTAMSTVNVTPGVCQSVCGGDGGASQVGSFLNSIGRWGVTLAGTLQGRPVTMTQRGTSIGPSAGYVQARTASFMPIIVILVIVVGAYFIFKR